MSLNLAVDSNDEKNQTIGMKLAPFNPTNHEACQIILDLFNLMNDICRNQGDIVLYDLGCGDARLLIHAMTRYHQMNQSNSFKCIGIEYDLNLVMKARENVFNHQLNQVCEIFDHFLGFDM